MMVPSLQRTAGLFGASFFVLDTCRIPPSLPSLAFRQLFCKCLSLAPPSLMYTAEAASSSSSACPSYGPPPRPPRLYFSILPCPSHGLPPLLAPPPLVCRSRDCAAACRWYLTCTTHNAAASESRGAHSTPAFLATSTSFLIPSKPSPFPPPRPFHTLIPFTHPGTACAAPGAAAPPGDGDSGARRHCVLHVRGRGRSPAAELPLPARNGARVPHPDGARREAGALGGGAKAWPEPGVVRGGKLGKAGASQRTLFRGGLIPTVCGVKQTRFWEGAKPENVEKRGGKPGEAGARQRMGH
eukprot:360170-Chlamydomonas_euryale.AAC.2